MSSNCEAHGRERGVPAQAEAVLRRCRTESRPARVAGGPRFPSCFLLVTLRFSGWRRAIPIVFPLFVLEDLLEAAGYLMSLLFFLCPSLSRRARADVERSQRAVRGAATAGGHWSSSYGRFADASGPRAEHGRGRGWFCVEFGPSWLFALARVVRTMRYQGRFTLVEVSDGSSGTEIAVGLV